MTCTFETISPSLAHSAVKHDSEKLGLCQLLCGALLFLATGALASPAQTFTSLLSFNGTNGANPERVNLAQGFDGNVYGTTSGGGTYGSGTVFRVTPTGALATLYSFCSQKNCPDGMQPLGGVLQGMDGNFYGTTSAGGANQDGTVFKMAPKGALTTLYSFDGADGMNPPGWLIQAPNGIIFGTTASGGANGYGTVFKITTAGALTTLHNFNDTDGSIPGGLVLATNGNIYGTTYQGGSNGYGTVFKITTTGVFTSLHSFAYADGANPNLAPIQAANSYFYGTTQIGGSGNGGTIFRMTAAGALTSLYSFSGGDGNQPIGGVTQATDGTFYGVTFAGGANDQGTIFRFTSARKLTILHNFDGTDGTEPFGKLTQATNGIFYGTTYEGGTDTYGTIYSLSVGLGPFVQTLPTSSKVGVPVIILGNNLTGATNVSFNGIAATFTVASGTEIKSHGAGRATAGTVAVTTPKGTSRAMCLFGSPPTSRASHRERAGRKARENYGRQPHADEESHIWRGHGNQFHCEFGHASDGNRTYRRSNRAHRNHDAGRSCREQRRFHGDAVRL